MKAASGIAKKFYPISGLIEHLKFKARLIRQLRFTNVFAQYFDNKKLVFIRGRKS